MPEELKSVEVRGKLVDALRLDLVGPSDILATPKKLCLSLLRAGI